MVAVENRYFLETYIVRVFTVCDCITQGTKDITPADNDDEDEDDEEEAVDMEGI